MRYDEESLTDAVVNFLIIKFIETSAEINHLEEDLWSSDIKKIRACINIWIIFDFTDFASAFNIY